MSEEDENERRLSEVLSEEDKNERRLSEVLSEEDKNKRINERKVLHKIVK